MKKTGRALLAAVLVMMTLAGGLALADGTADAPEVKFETPTMRYKHLIPEPFTAVTPAGPIQGKIYKMNPVFVSAEGREYFPEGILLGVEKCPVLESADRKAVIIDALDEGAVVEILQFSYDKEFCRILYEDGAFAGWVPVRYAYFLE